MAKKKKKELLKVHAPQWLIEQFKITGDEGSGIPEGLIYDRVMKYPVGKFWSKDFGYVTVEFEAASGQSNWWNTINVFNKHGDLISQSDPSFDLLGKQEYHLEDGTVIEFEVLPEPPPPREWSPRSKKLSGPTMGLDTAEERQHARAMAMQIHSLAREGPPLMRAEARGYLRAIRDLAIDENATELAAHMEQLMEDMK